MFAWFLFFNPIILSPLTSSCSKTYPKRHLTLNYSFLPALWGKKIALTLSFPSLDPALHPSVVLSLQRPKCFHINVMSVKREKINIKNCTLSILFLLNKNSDTLSILPCHEGNLQFVLFCFMMFMQNPSSNELGKLSISWNIAWRF